VVGGSPHKHGFGRGQVGEGHLSEIFIFRFLGGRIAETWGVVDVFSQLKQLGVIRRAPPEAERSDRRSPRASRSTGTDG
jgi:hypothetical protein